MRHQAWILGRPDRTGPTEMLSACYNTLYPVRSPTERTGSIEGNKERSPTPSLP